MFDVLIEGGRVIDGTGNPWFWGDIGIEGDRIREIGCLTGCRAKQTVKADSCYVCPGFFDLHTHSDLHLLADPLHECKVRQGITTEVLGHDGLGLAPVTRRTAAFLREQLASWNGEPDIDWNWNTVTTYLDRFEETTSVNVAMLLPHGTIRMAVVGMENRKPTTDEMGKMKALVELGMREGAVGLSTGLTYVPAMFSDDQELVELCRALRPYRGFYCPHHRNYGLEVLQANYDCIELAHQAGVPLHLTHCHVSTSANKGRANELLAAIDKAREAGVEVTLDSYPYLAGNTYLHSLLPSWIQEGGIEDVTQRLKNENTRTRLRHAMEVSGSDGFFGIPLGWEIIQIGSVLGDHDPAIVGRFLPDAAAHSNQSPFDFFVDLLIQTRFRVSCLVHIGDEDNVREIMCHPAHVVASDAILIGTRPHPRGWGSHARFLAQYVRDLGLLSWEEGIRKMTSASARRLGVMDRGILRPGFFADVVVFDPERLQDTATYESPISHAKGVRSVVVNGKTVVDDSHLTGLTPGRALRTPYGRVPVRVEGELLSVLGQLG